MKNRRTGKFRLLTAAGFFYIAAGTLISPPLLRIFAYADKNPVLKNDGWLWLLSFLLISFGAVTFFRKGPRIVNLHLFFVALFVAAPLAGEAALRIGIAFDLNKLKEQTLYGDYHSDDTYWKLRQEWKGDYRFASPQKVHPFLGWSQVKVSPENPLGLMAATRKKISLPGPKILFYGDSYVKGSVQKTDFQIPEYMSARLEGWEVVDLGVGGYGTDQVYLMFRETHLQVPDTRFYLVGILMEDLDRAVLSVRTSQKPYYEIAPDGELQLRGVPVAADQEKFFRRQAVKSYLFSLLKQRYFPSQKIELKKKINRKLLEYFKTDSEKAGIGLAFVLFYTEWDLKKESWQELFLKEEIRKIGSRYIDTKEFLLEAAKEKKLPLGAFYEGGGHHNDLGNEVVAEGIIESMEPLWAKEQPSGIL